MVNVTKQRQQTEKRSTQAKRPCAHLPHVNTDELLQIKPILNHRSYGSLLPRATCGQFILSLKSTFILGLLFWCTLPFLIVNILHIYIFQLKNETVGSAVSYFQYDQKDIVLVSFTLKNKISFMFLWQGLNYRHNITFL